MRWWRQSVQVRDTFGDEILKLRDAVADVLKRVDRLEAERIERWAAFESAIDKLIAVTMRQRKRQQRKDEAAEQDESLTNPLTGAPLDPISAAIHRRRGHNGPVRDQD